MASFSGYWTSIDTDRARFKATFSGGDSSFSYYRYVDLHVEGIGSFLIKSSAAGGSSSSFSKLITGLDPGTTYYWDAMLGYEKDSSGTIVWLDSWTDSGSFTTSKDVPAGAIHIYSGGYKQATPYIWTGSMWVPCTPALWSGGWNT